MWWHPSPHGPSADSRLTATVVRGIRPSLSCRGRVSDALAAEIGSAARIRAPHVTLLVGTGQRAEGDAIERGPSRPAGKISQISLTALLSGESWRWRRSSSTIAALSLVSQRPVVGFEGPLAFAADVTESLDLALQRLEPGLKPLKIIAPKSSIVFETVQELGE